MGFFCNDRLPFVNEILYSDETENCLYSYLLEKERGVSEWEENKRPEMCEQSGARQRGPLTPGPDKDQNHVFQKRVVVTFSAIVCFSFRPCTV